MDQDIKSQIQRTKDLLIELNDSCNSDLKTKTASEKTKNLTQEVLLKMRHVMDQAIHRFFEKEISPKLTTEQRKKAMVYFPFAKDKQSLKSTLGRGMMTDLETTNPSIYKIIESIQPYNPGYQWMADLAEYSNEKHIRLTPQEISEENETELGIGGHAIIKIGRKASVKMKGCEINGVPIDADNINTAPLHSFDPRLNVHRKTWISFNFQGTSTNILVLANTAINELEGILRKLFKEF